MRNNTTLQQTDERNTAPLVDRVRTLSFEPQPILEDMFTIKTFDGSETKDVQLMFETDGDVKKFFYSGGITDYNDWMERILNSTDSVYFRLSVNDDFAGFVKVFSLNESEMTCKVGVVVKQDFRNKGFAFKGVTKVIQGLKNLGIRKFHAYIHPENESSIHLFEQKLGFAHKTKLDKPNRKVFEMKV